MYYGAVFEIKKGNSGEEEGWSTVAKEKDRKKSHKHNHHKKDGKDKKQKKGHHTHDGGKADKQDASAKKHKKQASTAAPTAPAAKTSGKKAGKKGNQPSDPTACAEHGVWTDVTQIKHPPPNHPPLQFSTVDPEENQRILSSGKMTFAMVGCSGDPGGKLILKLEPKSVNVISVEQ